MASRGGSVESHLCAAERLEDSAPVVLLAECSCDGQARGMGWSGAARIPIEQNGPLAWVIAGLTVCPGYRRRGVGAQLVDAVIDEVAREDSGALLPGGRILTWQVDDPAEKPHQLASRSSIRVT